MKVDDLSEYQRQALSGAASEAAEVPTKPRCARKSNAKYPILWNELRPSMVEPGLAQAFEQALEVARVPVGLRRGDFGQVKRRIEFVHPGRGLAGLVQVAHRNVRCGENQQWVDIVRPQ